MDQSQRYADLTLREEDLVRGGQHILAAYKMQPKAGHAYLAESYWQYGPIDITS